MVGAKASGRDARDAAKRELAIVFKDWRSALAYSVGGELFKQTDGRETRRVQSANKPNALVESTNIHIHTYIYTHIHICEGNPARNSVKQVSRRSRKSVPSERVLTEGKKEKP